MRHDRDLIETIEAAIRNRGFCEHCGQPTAVAEHDGTLWVECSGRAGRKGVLLGLVTLDPAHLHTRQSILRLVDAA